MGKTSNSGKGGVKAAAKGGARRVYLLHEKARGGKQAAHLMDAKQSVSVLGSVIAGHSPFSTINGLSPIERSDLVERGVPAKLLTSLATKLHVSHDALFELIRVSRATANRARKANKALNPADSEQAMGMARLIGQVEQIVQESGDPEGFDAGRWVTEFLETEHPALGGRRPADLMHTSDGRAVVTTLVAQMQSGAYA